MVRRCIEMNLYVLSVTTTPSAWPGTRALARGAPRIQTALGLHPQIAHERSGEMPLFEQLLEDAVYVGEIGLEGGHDSRRHWRSQQQVFSRVLHLCSEAGGRVMTIHSRRAATPVLDQLESYPAAGTPVLHWFSGTSRELARAVALGCWFSVGPAMLSTNKARQLVMNMPKDRLLTESDGPFAQIGGHAAWPGDVERAVEALAHLWSESVQVVNRQLSINLRRLISKHSRV